MSTINDTIKWNCGTRILDKCSGILSNAEKFGLHLQVDSSRIDDVVDDRSADDHFHKSTKVWSEPGDNAQNYNATKKLRLIRHTAINNKNTFPKLNTWKWYRKYTL